MATHVPPPIDLSRNLLLAMVASSNAPLLLLDGDVSVIAASDSFARAFQLIPADLPGRTFFDLGAGEWNVPQLRSLLRATAAGHADIDAYEMDLRTSDREARRLIVNVRKLDYGDADSVRLLLTVTDVTIARVAERANLDLVREMDDIRRDKAILLKELQHRVANSLQIIASVLLQTARRVQSDETRSHLHDAHNRVMSVAALQKMLAVSSVDDVMLRPYFTDLCGSIAASMIRDPGRLALDVDVDESVITADVSVSLGLIVTELVINALKHAFPGDRAGRIEVAYRSDGASWTLTVRDNGVGMPKSTGDTKGGLGSSLVTALAKQLRAHLEIADLNPGTEVSIVHVRQDEAADAAI